MRMNHLVESHHTGLVLLSILIGIIASYATLDLSGRVLVSSGKTRMNWLISGSIILGSGIWSLHFIAMISHYLPIPVSYDVVLTVISMIAGIAGSFAGLYIISRNPHSMYRMIAAATALGAGITAMHYIGMAGMIMRADIHYNVGLVITSIIIAVSGAFTTFYFWHRYIKSNTFKGKIFKMLSTMFLAGGIAGLHYTAMSAASFSLLEQTPGHFSFPIIKTPMLTAGVSISSVIILTMMLISISIDKKMSIQSQRIRCLFDNHPNMVFELDYNGCIISMNDACQQLNGYNHSQLLHSPFKKLANKDEETKIQHQLERTLQNESSTFDMTLTYQDRTSMYAKVTTIPIVIDDRIQGMYGMAENVTELKKAEEKLRNMAYYDYLTELLNFRGYQQKMKEIEYQLEEHERISILYIDCDGFKEVNDTLGHESGDVFLTYFARLLQRSTAADDIICRVGGDEFAVILTRFHLERDVKELAETIINELSEPWKHNDSLFSMTASVGISCYPSDTTDINALLNKADRAMYQAKRSGKSSYYRYTQDQTTI